MKPTKNEKRLVLYTGLYFFIFSFASLSYMNYLDSTSAENSQPGVQNILSTKETTLNNSKNSAAKHLSKKNQTNKQDRGIASVSEQDIDSQINAVLDTYYEKNAQPSPSSLKKYDHAIEQIDSELYKQLREKRDQEFARKNGKSLGKIENINGTKKIAVDMRHNSSRTASEIYGVSELHEQEEEIY